MTRRLTGAFTALLTVLPLAAQTSGFHPPLSGFVYHRASRTVRPLLGITGAARIGSPLLNGVDFASVSPHHDWAIVAKAGQTSCIHGLADFVPADCAAAGLIDAVDRVVWNRDGSVALLYSSTGNQLQRVMFSDTGAATDSPIDLSPWGVPTALAIDPAGRQIAFGIAQSGLYVFAAGHSPALLASIAQPAAAAFDSTGRLYAIDLDQRQILQFDSGTNQSVFASLGDPDAPAVTPVGLTVSGDGRSLLLADSTAKAIRVYDVASASLTATLALDFVPTRFEAVSPAPTILLNGDNSGEWLLILDAARVPSLSFVPAATAAPEAAQ